MAEDDAIPSEDAEADEAPADVVPGPESVHGVPVTWSGDQQVLHPSRDGVVALVKALGADGFHLCLDVCGVDYLTHRGRSTLPDGLEPERFEVVIHLLSHREARRVRLRVQVPADDATMPSLFDLHPGVEAMEREAFDMYGIEFEGHPDLTRILMPEDWVGHPLRKDYGIGAIPVQFKQAPSAR